MPFPNEHSCRLASPGSFRKDSFRRKKSGKVSLVMAKRPGSDTMELQSIRYPIADWSEGDARESCKEKGGTFEPAAPKEKSVDTTVKDYLVSRIHQSFTVAADQLYGLGIIKEQDERIAISSVIGDALTLFTKQFDEKVENKVIPADTITQMMEQGWMDKMKEISAEEIILLAEQHPNLSDYQLVEKALGKGQGVGDPKQGVGGTDVCVCPKCGYEIVHGRGTPCAEMECPECGVALVGKEEKAVGEGRGVGGERRGESEEGEGASRICVCSECGEKVEHERNVPCAEMRCPKCDAMMEGWEAATAEEELKFHTIVGENGMVSLVLGKKSWELGEK